jgi:hypothetical protein
MCQCANMRMCQCAEVCPERSELVRIRDFGYLKTPCTLRILLFSAMLKTKTNQDFGNKEMTRWQFGYLHGLRETSMSLVILEDCNKR